MVTPKVTHVMMYKRWRSQERGYWQEYDRTKWPIWVKVCKYFLNYPLHNKYHEIKPYLCIMGNTLG